MLTEDYISYETAKLLKEKGFNWECIGYYVDYEPDDVKYSFLGETNSTWESRCCSAPTIQMAMKWLRKVHNLVIEPYRTACGYLYTISSIPYGSTKYDNSEAYNGDDEDSGQWSTWEKACEDGIKYCLENLI